MNKQIRAFRFAFAAAVLAGIGTVNRAVADGKYVAPEEPAVKAKLEWFQDQKLCLMMHFGVYSFPGITESWPLVTQDAFWSRKDVEWTDDDAAFKAQYFALNRCFNPNKFYRII